MGSPGRFSRRKLPGLGWTATDTCSGRARNATLEGRVESFDRDDLGAAERGELQEPDVDENMTSYSPGSKEGRRDLAKWCCGSLEGLPVAYCRDPQEWMALTVRWSARTGSTPITRGLESRSPARTSSGSGQQSRSPSTATTGSLPRRGPQHAHETDRPGPLDIDLERSFAEASKHHLSPSCSSTSTTSRRSTTSTEGMAKAIGYCVKWRKILAQCRGPWGLVYRYGGEEITVILPGFGESEGAAVAERLRESVERVDWRLVHSIGDGQHWRRERARRQDHQSSAVLQICRPGDVFSQGEGPQPRRSGARRRLTGSARQHPERSPLLSTRDGLRLRVARIVVLTCSWPSEAATTCPVTPASIASVECRRRNKDTACADVFRPGREPFVTCGDGGICFEVDPARASVKLPHQVNSPRTATAADTMSVMNRSHLAFEVRPLS